MPVWCPDCHAMLAEDSQTCPRCGAKLAEQEDNAVLSGREIIGISAFTIGIILIAIGVPLIIGLLCFWLGK